MTTTRRNPLDASRPFATLGSTGLRQFSGNVDEEFHRALRGSLGVRLYREMADNDPVVGGILHLVDCLVRQVDFYTEPASEDPRALEAAAFVDSCLEDMRHSWEDFISEVLTMLPYGWALFEVVYKQRLGDRSEGLVPVSRFNDFRIGWESFEIRAQDTLDKWEFGKDASTVTGMYQLPPPSYNLCYIPIEKALLFRTRAHKGNPEGRSILRNAYRPWYFKKRLEEIEAIGVERDLAGLPHLQVPPDMLSENASASDKALVSKLERWLAQIRRDERDGIITPSESYTDPSTGQTVQTGWKFDLISSGGSRSIAIDTAIQRYDHRIAVSLLADFTMLGSGPTGSWALSADKTDMFALAIGAVLDSICGVLNTQAIPPLMRLNGYASDLWPRFSHGDVEAPPLTEVATYVSQLVGAGTLTPDEGLEKTLRDYASLPQLGEDGGTARIRKRRLPSLTRVK